MRERETACKLFFHSNLTITHSFFSSPILTLSLKITRKQRILLKKKLMKFVPNQTFIIRYNAVFWVNHGFFFVHKLIYIGLIKLIKCKNFDVNAGSIFSRIEPNAAKTSLNASKHFNSIRCDLSFMN